MPRGIAFKFLRGPSVLVMVNSKAASRASSGKLVTIYPRDDPSTLGRKARPPQRSVSPPSTARTWPVT
ncbi:hypothetical protein ACIBHX_05700 [Nonomuraea sp. NPDC050536]|uniref:class III lanthionine synthetase LanKC N-terminal domain-containing protein n=1 Tax=Nonomuraea sp. NPDC050536 TaxID=3364366 RepID=UPI0037CB27DC